MNTKAGCWFGVVLHIVAIVAFVSSMHIYDVPGPMEGNKPEFTFFFSAPLVILAVILALAGETFLIWNFRRKA